jgi:ADP-dependent NAD(P)H-hydrate dehydratase / NAD(P)H-hydrate epimerase
MLHAPAIDAHKYSRGMVAIVGGDMPGAALLAAEAAMRIAGYVALVDGGVGGPYALVRKTWDDLAGDTRVGALLIGPGLGLSQQSCAKLDAALATDHPIVIDGDALTILGARGQVDFQGRATILTPHEGEFGRMFPGISGERPERALAAAAGSGVVVVLKGAQTVVATPSGDVSISPLASPWLASAGTGDVLAGIVAGLLSTGLPPFDAACAAVWLHGEWRDWRALR